MNWRLGVKEVDFFYLYYYFRLNIPTILIDT